MFYLKIVDFLFFWLHILIIGFNLFGWVVPSWRQYHLIGVMITLGSWLILGIWHGLGYCFLTDWHWKVKTRLGETGLPASFVKYFFDNYTSLELSAKTVDNLTIISFAAAVILGVTLFVLKKHR